MSDSNQGGTPAQNPAGQPPGGENPSGQPPAGESPYGQPPAGQSPYGQPPAGQSPYGQPPAGQSAYGQPPPAQSPYGTAPYAQQPSGSPYAQQPPPGPLGDWLDMYGRPLGTDQRPGTVTAAAWTTIILSGLTALLFAVLTLAMVVAKNDVLEEIDKALAEQGATGDFNAEDAFGAVVGVMLVLTVWCVIACVLAVLALRRSNVARILLVISATVAGLLSLIAISSGISAVWLVACLAVVILLFTGGAGDWYARRRRY